MALFSVMACSVARAEGIVYQAGLGFGPIWYADNAKPSDVEASIHGSASLTPHISGVASAAFGFDNSYARGSAGLRFPITDALNPNFGVSLGIQRHFSSEPLIRPEEWAPDVSLGWRPAPTMPRVSFVAISAYGLTSNLVSVGVGIRYRFTGEYVQQPPPGVQP